MLLRWQFWVCIPLIALFAAPYVALRCIEFVFWLLFSFSRFAAGLYDNATNWRWLRSVAVFAFGRRL